MESECAAPVHLNAEPCDVLSVATEQIENVVGGRGGWLFLNVGPRPIEGSFGGCGSEVNREPIRFVENLLINSNLKLLLDRASAPMSYASSRCGEGGL